MPTTARVSVKPQVLRWAIERAGKEASESLVAKNPQIASWISGKSKPTLRQLEDFARAARVSVGYLFLDAPPIEKLPIEDLRTMKSKGVTKPSGDLLDVVYLCQRRQEWYRDFAIANGEPERTFVGSATVKTSTAAVAADMRKVVGFDVKDRENENPYFDPMRLFISHAEKAGVLVMASGIVGANTHRPLDPSEFRGFTLSDRVAPLVFVNTKDVGAAQVFTLAHELAHLWLGSSALTNSGLVGRVNSTTERWCNAVAAEFLVPADVLRKHSSQDPLSQVSEFRKIFRVSGLVIIRRLRDVGLIDRTAFSHAYAGELQRAESAEHEAEGSGGNFILTHRKASSKRFIKALYADTIAGNTTFSSAMRLLGISKAATFRELAKTLDAA